MKTLYTYDSEIGTVWQYGTGNNPMLYVFKWHGERGYWVCCDGTPAIVSGPTHTLEQALIELTAMTARELP